MSLIRRRPSRVETVERQLPSAFGLTEYMQYLVAGTGSSVSQSSVQAIAYHAPSRSPLR